MYWDIVEVKPEEKYRLFVRFRDGLSGHVQLRDEDFTGALAPLREIPFFQQAFVDNGAVAWPGEIDLAPDEMYTQVKFRNRLPRFYELWDLIANPSAPESYDFVGRLRIDDEWIEGFVPWERALDELDAPDWDLVRRKVTLHLQRPSRMGRWEQLFNILGEALGYRYLKSIGWSRVHFLPESDHSPTPDLEGTQAEARVLCEVKTINPSDEEIQERISTSQNARDVSPELKEGFFRKLDDDIAEAKDQLQRYDPTQRARHMVFINICFDDWLAFYRTEYFQQIQQHLLNQPPGVEVVATSGASSEPRVVASR